MQPKEFDIFKIKHNNISPKQGRVLISVPFLKDNFFKKSIILLTEYDKDGALGFVLNKPYEYRLHEILDNVPESEIMVSYGGPVSMDSLHFIHTLGMDVPGTFEVYNGIFWGGDFEYIIEGIKNGVINENNIRFFIGYAGWGAGQLDNEIKGDTWLVGKLPNEKIMNNADNDLWDDALQTLGSKYALWTNFPDDPKLN